MIRYLLALLFIIKCKFNRNEPIHQYTKAHILNNSFHLPSAIFWITGVDFDNLRFKQILVEGPQTSTHELAFSHYIKRLCVFKRFFDVNLSEFEGIC